MIQLPHERDEVEVHRQQPIAKLDNVESALAPLSLTDRSLAASKSMSEVCLPQGHGLSAQQISALNSARIRFTRT